MTCWERKKLFLYRKEGERERGFRGLSERERQRLDESFLDSNRCQPVSSDLRSLLMCLFCCCCCSAPINMCRADLFLLSNSQDSWEGFGTLLEMNRLFPDTKRRRNSNSPLTQPPGIVQLYIFQNCSTKKKLRKIWGKIAKARMKGCGCYLGQNGMIKGLY